MKYHITLASKNAKTGPIPVTTTAQDSCPTSCPFATSNKGGCYAMGGPLAIHWRKVSDGSRGDNFDVFLDKIKRFPKGQLWRHNQAGDLPGIGDSLDVDSMFKLVNANRGRRGFTYTHKPLKTDKEREAIKISNMAGFTVNLSANNLNHADELIDLKIGPVVVVLPSDQLTNTVTPKGNKIVICPAITRDDVTCASCGLCQIAKRDCIVGFPAHGIQKAKATGVSMGDM